MDLFTVENAANLGILIFLQAVLGFDIALGLRVVLLFLIMQLLDSFQSPFFEIHWQGVLVGSFNFATLVFLLGGGFLMYTAVKEIGHLLSMEHLDQGAEQSPKSARQVIMLIVLMNLVFSFDSILSALAITKVFAVLAIAIVASGIAMLVLADTVSEFLQRNRKYEVLGLFILLIVGVVLLGEGGHEAHLHLFDYPVEPMAKTTFYFAIAVLVLVDVLQSGYQKKLGLIRAEHAGSH